MEEEVKKEEVVIAKLEEKVPQEKKGQKQAKKPIEKVEQVKR